MLADLLALASSSFPAPKTKMAVAKRPKLRPRDGEFETSDLYTLCALDLNGNAGRTAVSDFHRDTGGRGSDDTPASPV